MKILRVISSVNPACGGPVNGLINSTRELLLKGHNIDILSLDAPLSEWVSDFEFPLVTFKSILGTYSYSNKFFSWLDNNVAKYDVVIIHGLWQFHSYATAKACVQHTIPYVVFTHGMLDPWFNLNNKLKTFKKNIYWKLLEQFVIKNANKVLFTSQEECKLARKSFSPYCANERVVAYGCSQIPGSAREFKQAFNLSFPELKNKKIGLFLSRIHEKKGIDLLINALAELPDIDEDFVLAIAGPDSNGLKEKLQAQSVKLGIDNRIVWLGMVTGDVKWGAYYAADFFILPSHQENFGIVVAEALSTSTPALITNKVNIWHEIERSDAGFVGNDDLQGIKQILIKWFKLSNSEKKDISKRANSCYQANFSIAAASNDLERALLDVCHLKNGIDNLRN